MGDRSLKWLYYIAWAVGFFAAGLLIYGIIRSFVWKSKTQWATTP